MEGESRSWCYLVGVKGLEWCVGEWKSERSFGQEGPYGRRGVSRAKEPIEYHEKS